MAVKRKNQRSRHDVAPTTALAVIRFLHGANLIDPILYHFYSTHGSVGLAEIAMTFRSCMSLYLELPCGAIADTFGLNQALILSSLCHLLSVAVLYVGTGPGVLVHAFLSALGGCLSSGAIPALMYESVVQNKDTDNYVWHAGVLHAAWGAGALVSSILFACIPAESALYQSSILTFLFNSLTLLIAMKISPLQAHKKASHVIPYHIREASKVVIQSRILMYCVLVSCILSFIPQHVDAAEWWVEYFDGGVSVAGHLVCSWFVGMSNLIPFSCASVSTVAGSLASVPHLAASYPVVVIALHIFQTPLLCFVHPLVDLYQNRACPSGYRATVLSIISLCKEGTAMIVDTILIPRMGINFSVVLNMVLGVLAMPVLFSTLLKDKPKVQGYKEHGV